MNEIKNYILSVETLSKNSSKIWENSDEVNYPFAFGYTLSETQCMLSKLNLSKKQIKILESLSVKNINNASVML
jgi:hypothetical protein